ncbi:AraC family transcriptional regulator [Cohnella sp. REN36]|uniref:helix-turn-helix transcriptional regulator n=1 Tax=Cohnella sp. REN36 TaxID=2887347 RepID=UPI001D15A0A4|nr:helix-turn-helix domain-containing protein [Cohnella sp. REN36]MCC3372080.1 AraC family transcriptional regulator [Cohnella sp. REN36]
MIHLYGQDLLDSVTEAHYAYHKSLNTVTGEHSHDFYEVFLITKGAFYHQVNRRRTYLSEGHLVFIRPNDVHYYENDDRRDGELINLAFSTSTMEALVQYLGGGFELEKLLQPEESPCVFIDKHELDALKERLQLLTFISAEDKPRMRREVRALLAEIFVRYFSESPMEEIDSGMPDWLEQVQKKMQNKENFSEGISRLNELCPKSPEHLSRMIKKHFGQTPTEWINGMRLKYAANLLVYTDESVIEISMEAGYKNLSHFYHRFKEYYGSSPAQYRKLHRKIIIPN